MLKDVTDTLPDVIPAPLPGPKKEPSPSPQRPPIPVDPEDKKDHRGRLQVQCDDIVGHNEAKNDTLSWNWARNSPLPVWEALAELSNLKAKLNKKQLKLRDEAFRKVERYIQNAAVSGGVYAYTQRTFQNRGFADSDKEVERHARVDIEVKTGIAFVP